MSTLTAENIIPKYSLAESTYNQASAFYIYDYDEETRQLPLFFLKPHRKDFYLFVFIKSGQNRHWVDMVPYDIKPNTFYFTVPHQVHVKEDVAPVDGKFLCFTETFLALSDNSELLNLPIIKNPYNGHELHLSDSDVLYIDDLITKINDEYRAGNDWKNSMLHAYLRVLIIYLSRLYVQQYQGEETSTEKLLLKRFRSLVEDNYKQLHDVASYAELLNISASHMSEVIKQQSGKSAIEHIHGRLLLEAEGLLFHTTVAVKELSYLLGFSDVSYFVRFFKRVSGKTPLSYRMTTRKMYHPNQ